MKKAYIKPMAEIVNVDMQHVMTASGGITFGDDDFGSGSLNDSSADEGIEALSLRLFGF